MTKGRRGGGGLTILSFLCRIKAFSEIGITKLFSNISFTFTFPLQIFYVVEDSYCGIKSKESSLETFQRGQEYIEPESVKHKIC